MSIGYCGKAQLIAEDETMLIYSYACYNLNLRNWQEMKVKEDGKIYIKREAFIDPEIHEKLKRMPSGRKKLIRKRICLWVRPGDLIQSGLISVKNASGTWEKHEDGIDFMAYNLIRKLINEYQDTGKIPQSAGFFS